jgi:hypothetical protein
MFRLLKGLLGLTILAGAVYAAVAIPIGGKTLWGHVRAIAGSKESKELVDGVRDKVDDVVKKDGKASKGEAEQLSDQERKVLRKLIRDKLGEETNK